MSFVYDYKPHLCLGIHGQPIGAWDEDTAPVTQGVGYCTHDSILFPTWHRPYMLLYEVRSFHTAALNFSGRSRPLTQLATDIRGDEESRWAVSSSRPSSAE